MSLLKVCIFAALIGLAGSPVWGQTFQPVYSFPADSSTGRSPYATLTVGPDGDLYGTAIAGGAFDAGTAFKLSPTSEAFTVLGDFDGETTGLFPYSRLLNIGDGYLYGVTEKSSFTSIDWRGTVYRLDPDGGLSQVFQIPGEDPDQLNPIPTYPRALTSGEANTLHVLGADYPGLWRVPLDGSDAEVVYSFADDSIDGGHARTIIRGTDGHLYGTTIGSADAGDYPNGRGTIFRIGPDGMGMTTLHECQYETGTRPNGALVEAPDGNFYGVMWAGGKGGSGCVFRITPGADYKVLYYFGTRTNDLRAPYGDLLLASDGQLYGTTREGGDGYGGVFRIKTDGTGYKILHTFNNSDGAYPEAGLVQAGDGNLYGTTTEGGSGRSGTIFRIKLNLPAPPVNRPPVAVNDVGVSTGNSVVIQVTANDYDPDGDALLVAIQNAPSFGSAVVQMGGSILYTPNAAYAGSDSFTYTISDGRGGTASGTVRIRGTEPGPLVQAGIYNGLLMLDPDLNGEGDLPRAQFLLSVSANRSFTGILLTQRKRVPFRGTFTTGGIAVANLKLPNKRAAALFLSFQAGESSTLVGALFGPELWSGVAGRLQSSGSAVKESYTILAEGSSSVTAGYGFGVMKVLPNGLVSVAGKLGDGSKLSWGTSLVSMPNSSTAIPVYSEPLKGGVCGGFLVHSVNSTQDFAGTVRWMRPSASKPTKPYALGFNDSAAVTVARFTPSPTTAGVLELADGSVRLGNGPMAGVVAGDFTLNGNKVATASPLRALSINRKTGLFAGKMQVGKKTVSFQGVVSQALNVGAGQFSIGGVTGAVELQSADIVAFE